MTHGAPLIYRSPGNSGFVYLMDMIEVTVTHAHTARTVHVLAHESWTHDQVEAWARACESRILELMMVKSCSRLYITPPTEMQRKYWEPRGYAFQADPPSPPPTPRKKKRRRNAKARR